MATGAQRRLDAFNATHDCRRLPYYDLLGVSQAATQAEVTRAFRKLSLRFHPDKPGGDKAKFQELNKAYKCLRDEVSRRKYDDCGFDEDNICTDEVDQFVDAFFGEGARGVDGRSPDWNTGKVENYTRIQLEEVPIHMRDIVRIGLNYLLSLDHDFQNVVLLQHSRVDILYLMVGMLSDGDLTQEIFDSEESYPITYYDNPLQPGIAPRWSDQNVLGAKKARKKPNVKELPRRELNFEEFQRRQKHALAMLENGPPDPMVALEEKYRAKMLATEHERQVKSIRGQDIYEDDAELDCNAFADSLTQERSGAVSSSSAPTSAGSRIAQDIYENDSELDCNRLAETLQKTAELAKGEHSMMAYQSQGTEPVLGCNSDGVLFVAKGGKVLRNEGPPRPQAPQHVAGESGAPVKAAIEQPRNREGGTAELGCLPRAGTCIWGALFGLRRAKVLDANHSFH
mmetsp:Transcript_105924/g.309812  ORF Transcript_105924/g.309812 Transcript_105924/m.309812 type:complete len:455 (-) Transcript_105924:206-1570(-)